MKILVLSFYFSPDLSAGSFRCTALAEKLDRLGVEVELITTLPNRYSTFSANAPALERNGNLTIHRIALPPHKSGMLDQAKAFYRYYAEALRIAKTNQYDIVFSTSSRLFTAFLGARVAGKKGIPLYLDIRDIFVDTIKDVLSPKLSWFAKPIFSMIERYTFKRAQRINLVSRGFSKYFQKKYPKTEYRWFTNGIDEEFINLPSITADSSRANGVKRVVYAGNFGEGQGLHCILPGLARVLKGRFEFVVIGDGGRKQQLIDSVAGLDNVSILPPITRDKLIVEYLKADVLFLHLNDYPAFRKVLPSKIFEYAALGKPILAGVAGYSAEFLRNEVSNAAVFTPCDVQGALAQIERLELNDVNREEFVNKFARKKIAEQMAQDICEFAALHKA